MPRVELDQCHFCDLPPLIDSPQHESPLFGQQDNPWFGLDTFEQQTMGSRPSILPHKRKNTEQIFTVASNTTGPSEEQALLQAIEQLYQNELGQVSVAPDYQDSKNGLSCHFRRLRGYHLGNRTINPRLAFGQVTTNTPVAAWRRSMTDPAQIEAMAAKYQGTMVPVVKILCLASGSDQLGYYQDILYYTQPRWPGASTIYVLRVRNYEFKDKEGRDAFMQKFYDVSSLYLNIRENGTCIGPKNRAIIDANKNLAFQKAVRLGTEQESIVPKTSFGFWMIYSNGRYTVSREGLAVDPGSTHIPDILYDNLQHNVYPDNIFKAVEQAYQNTRRLKK